MKKITFRELEKIASYGDYTLFVYDDGTKMTEGSDEINEGSIHCFYQAECIELYDMDELPSVKEMMRANFVEQFSPADGVEDEGFDWMVTNFANGNGKIAKCEANGATTYMLIQ